VRRQRTEGNVLRVYQCSRPSIEGLMAGVRRGGLNERGNRELR